MMITRTKKYLFIYLHYYSFTLSHILSGLDKLTPGEKNFFKSK